jgi:hypothetical protein
MIDRAAADRRREQKTQWDRNAAAARATLPGIPPVNNPERRERCGSDFRLFCEEYRPDAFKVSWSDDHRYVLERVQATTFAGGLFALAMPRGAGKTTITMTAAIWALLYGYRRWVCLVGATEPKSVKLLKGIKTELRFNQQLYEDFPEACVPIRALEGKPQRATNQMIDGNPTSMVWAADQLTFPTIRGSVSSASLITTCGILGDIRGQQDVTQDGEVIRPDYVCLDDPQTRASAYSNRQTDDRIDTLNGDILGLAGPNTKIAGVMPCTVIRRGDMADMILNRDLAPEWHGKRTKLIASMPTRMDMWETYQEIREADFRNDGDGSPATEYYSQNRIDMDLGSMPSWVERFYEDEISATQNCMNLYFRDEATFAAEYQNEPLELKGDDTLTVEQISERVNGYELRVVPTGANKVTAFIDVQQNCFYFCVAAWTPKFTGYVLEYGAFPDQRALNFRYSQAKNTLGKRYPGLSVEAAISKGLGECIDMICEKTYVRDDGLEMQIDRLLVDGNWQTDVVYESVRQSAHKSKVDPARGTFVGAATLPLNERQKREAGKIIGVHWRVEKSKGSIRHVVFDSNHWKSFIHARIATDPAERGSLTFYKATPRHHKTFASHLKAEYAVRVEGRGRECDEWKIRPDRPDNHWFDCLSGTAIAASVEGVTLTATGEQGHKPIRERKKDRVAYL